MTICPICDSLNFKSTEVGDLRICECGRCGKFKLSRELNDDLLQEKRDNEFNLWSQITSHYLCRQHLSGKTAELTHQVFGSLKQTPPPSFPMEQANNLILWFGDEGQKKQGKQVQPEPYARMIAIAGAQDEVGLRYVINALQRQELLEDSDVGLRLTFKGWERYEELKQGTSVGNKTAFMAMEFNQPELESIYKGHFREAVKATGFELHTVKGRAGPINDHIMNDIRVARFVVADLTHHNNGAYWEAGFAEGLGKPVFYTCKKSVFKSDATHFDVNHHHTILWDDDKDIEAANNLKAIIRNTLPLEAKMTGD